MKRSKIFLGISSGILALVAFTAAKTAKFAHLKNAYYYAGASNLRCTLKASLEFYSVGSTIQATNGQSPSKNLYTFNSGGRCTNPLFKTGTE